MFTLDIPSYQAVQMHARNRALREELYLAFISRASSGSVDNSPLIERTLALKRERAELLGYPNHAEVSLASKMATLDRAEKLIEELRAATFEPAKRELEDVRAFAREKGAAEAAELKHWDVGFWAERLREEKYGLKEEGARRASPPSIRLARVVACESFSARGVLTPLAPFPASAPRRAAPVLPAAPGARGSIPLQAGRTSHIRCPARMPSLSTFGPSIPHPSPARLRFASPQVLDGLFALAKRLFDVDISAADGEAPVWHPDVRYFVIKDRSGAPVASFYLDPYSRPAEKRGGAWMDEVVGRSKLFARGGKAARLPVAHMVCNGTPPVGGKPSLMTFREVETLFHEMGHALQHMLTRVDEGLVAGIRGVEWDAVELPSQARHSAAPPRTVGSVRCSGCSLESHR